VNNDGQQAFTRDGSLTVDAAGNLTTESGGEIQGWEANANGVVNTGSPIGNITIPTTTATIAATPTSTLTLGGNLPAWSGTGTPPAPVTTTYNAYDSLGDTVPVTVTFTPATTGAGDWTMTASVPNPTTGDPEYIVGTAGSGGAAPTGIAVDFNSTGQVTSVAGSTTNSDGSFSLSESAPAGYSFPTGDKWTVSFPAPNTEGAVTQYNAAESLQVTADGNSSGTLTGFSIGDNGVITGSFSNGNTQTLGQIALADFSNAGGLTDAGGGLFTTSANSGQALVGAAGTGARGTLLGGELEQSNVDLATELTDLITAQEAYTANTKVLTTSDTVIQSLESVQ